LEQLRELVKVAVAPRDTKDYEEKLKSYTKGTFYLQSGYMPRIYDLEKFHRVFTKYLDKFVQTVVFLSGSPDIILPLNSQKDGLQEGFIQILFQQDNLPKNYIKFIREKMVKVDEENDDIISFIKRLKESHRIHGYKIYESIKSVSKSFVQDYPYESKKEAGNNSSEKSTYQRKTSNFGPGGHFKNSHSNQKTMSHIIDDNLQITYDHEEVELQRKEAHLELLKIQELEQELVFTEDFHAMGAAGGYQNHQSQH
jgi:hypothetical protein